MSGPSQTHATRAGARCSVGWMYWFGMQNTQFRSDAKWAVLAAVLMLWSTAARADSAALLCLGSTTTFYTPGITNTPRQVAFSGDVTLGCVGLPFLFTSAAIHTEGQGQLSCTLQLAPVPSQLSVTWGDGTSSTAVGQTVVNVKNLGELVFVLTGTVTQGRFLGATLVRTLTIPNLNLGVCDSPEGLTVASGPVTLEVVGGQ
jgi:hypothetical protein